MEKLLILFIIMLSAFLLQSCSYIKHVQRAKEVKDSLVADSIFRDSMRKKDSVKFAEYQRIMSTYKLDAQKDSIIWDEHGVKTPLEEKDALFEKYDRYPDSIKVSFTRDGKFEDSIMVCKDGFVQNKKKQWEPAYTFTAAVGDIWVYDARGKFRLFIECPLPHDGQGHKYNP